MNRPPAPRAAGFLIAMALIAGAIIGTIAGQPSIGVIAGGVLGIGAALLLWLADRRT